MSFQFANWDTFYGCSFAFKVVNFLYYLKTKEHSLPTVLTVLTFKLQFSYCAFVYMCHSRILNNNIKKLHDICLRLSYNDKHSTFHELLKKKVVSFLFIHKTCDFSSRRCINQLKVRQLWKKVLHFEIKKDSI